MKQGAKSSAGCRGVVSAYQDTKKRKSGDGPWLGVRAEFFRVDGRGNPGGGRWGAGMLGKTHVLMFWLTDLRRPTGTYRAPPRGTLIERVAVRDKRTQ